MILILQSIWLLPNGSDHGPALTFDKAGLRQCDPPLSILDNLPIIDSDSDSDSDGKEANDNDNYFKRPPAVNSSPVQMHCRLALEVTLLNSSTMILLQIDTYVINGKILRNQSTLYPGKTSIQGNPDVRSITAKIDCLLLRPLSSLGNGRFGCVRSIYHMGRPRPKELSNNEVLDENRRKKRELSNSQKLINSCKPNNTSKTATESTAVTTLDDTTCNNIDWQSSTMWEIDDLVLASTIPSQYDNNNSNIFEEVDGNTITYTYRIDSICPLGYNPMKQVVCPRCIGWISMYEPASSLKLCEEKSGSSSSKSGEGPISHISPYSFCIDVARGSRPMVAFAACPRSDEFVNSDNDESDGNSTADLEEGASNNDRNGWKDAQRSM